MEIYFSECMHILAACGGWFVLAETNFGAATQRFFGVSGEDHQGTRLNSLYLIHNNLFKVYVSLDLKGSGGRWNTSLKVGIWGWMRFLTLEKIFTCVERGCASTSVNESNGTGEITVPDAFSDVLVDLLFVNTFSSNGFWSKAFRSILT